MIRLFSASFSYILLLLLFASSDLMAEFLSDQTQVEVGSFASSISYEEPNIMNENGTMAGFIVSISWRTRVLRYFDTFRLEALASAGRLDYSSPNSGSMEGILNGMIDARVITGRDILRIHPAVVSWYYGLGYRWLIDRSGGMITSIGAIGYDRESRYLYIPVGLGLSTKLDNSWLFEGKVEYDLFLKGTQTSYLTQMNNAFFSYSNDTVNEQYDGYGFRVALKFSNDNLAFEPFLRYWNVGRSRYDYYTLYTLQGSQPYQSWEPVNNSIEYGLGITALF
ncbi:MAG: hypothetical protein HGA97_09460 [Chlorobiaceae bacterium]|nr:hypothetical protein [Chlorobiaceae bacterium]